MKIENYLESKLKKIKPNPVRRLQGLNSNERKNSEKQQRTFSPESNKEMKIIGVTGSKGKSTTAFLIHNFLKSQGYRSILYSSIEIDSPASYCAPKEAVENPIRDEVMLLDAIIQAKEYNADYLILEINERALSKGIIEGVPFNVRLITNIFPTHNSDFYSPEDYVALKQSFFSKIPDEEDCTCIFGVESKEIFNALTTNNSKKKVIFGSKYLASVRGVNENDVDYLLYSNSGPIDTLKGLYFMYKTRYGHVKISSKLIMPYNAMNMLAAIAVLDTLGVMDAHAFQMFINNIRVPGRDQKVESNGRTIVVSSQLTPELEIFNKYKVNGEFKRLTVVVGSTGYGHKTWIKEFKDEVYEKESINSMNYAYNYINNYADLVYITTSDIGNKNPYAWMSQQESLLKSNIKVKKIPDRKEAIKLSIQESQVGDLIYISGRGNRRVACISEDDIALYVDYEMVTQALGELNWEIQEDE